MRESILIVLAAAAALLRPGDASACAPAPHPGEIVTIAAEEALIVWDAARRTEHFIRRADFRTDAEDFGFLVPTPTQPELAEASDAVFNRLHRRIQPEERTETEWLPHTCLTASLFFFMARSAPETAVMAPGGAPEEVRVLATARVAGLDATVLDADSATALTEWLDRHGYATRPALTRWLEPYVRAHFKVTAFKIAKGGEDAPEVGSRSVRMTFRTDRPYFPYREPSDHEAGPGRAFRVYTVAPSRLKGAVEAGRGPWAASTEYARPLTDASDLLAGAVPPDAIPEGAWLTSFMDLSSRREPGDLYFRSSRAGEVVPPPIIHTEEQLLPIPVEPVLLGLFIWWIVRRSRRRRARPASA